MTDYFVGPGGLDANSGLTWALRKLTLNGAEAVPVAPADNVYVGPGVYREQLNLNVDGTPGNPITYIADVTGENTDGIGGIVRGTGSDNDQTPTRAYCINGNGDDYRTFRGFFLDGSTTRGVRINNCDNFILEDSVLFHHSRTIGIESNSQNVIIRRSLFGYGGNSHVFIFSGVGSVDDNILLENCIFFSSHFRHLDINNIGGVTLKSCLLTGSQRGVEVTNLAVPGDVPCNVIDSVVVNHSVFGLRAAALGQLTEDNNCVYGNNVDRSNVAVGAASVAYMPIFLPPILLDGFVFPYHYGKLSEWSQIRALAGTATPSDDFFGLARPAGAAKFSWGPMQFHDAERDTGTVRTGVASLALLDAGDHQMFVPEIDGTEITVECYVNREVNYAGGNPQMIIRQPGQADRITTDAGAAGAFNQLTDTFTPAALPGYIVVILRSRNTAAAGNYTTFFDDLDVS